MCRIKSFFLLLFMVDFYAYFSGTWVNPKLLVSSYFHGRISQDSSPCMAGGGSIPSRTII